MTLDSEDLAQISNLVETIVLNHYNNIKSDIDLIISDITSISSGTGLIVRGIGDIQDNIAQNLIPDRATIKGIASLISTPANFFLSKLDSLKTSVDTIDVSAITSSVTVAVNDVISNNISNVIADASLNGYGAEFKDGDMVNVVGRDVVYSVNRSFFSMYADNAYTIHYDVISSNGQRMMVPEALLTRYISTAP